MLRSLFFDWYGQHFGKEKIAVTKYSQALMWGAFAAGYKAAQQSVQRTCPHAETFIDPVSGYVTCMACGEPLHEASR